MSDTLSVTELLGLVAVLVFWLAVIWLAQR